MSERCELLAIDLGRLLGWCAFLEGYAPTCGGLLVDRSYVKRTRSSTKELCPEGRTKGELLFATNAFLCLLIGKYQPRAIVYEAVLQMRPGEQRAARLMGQAGIVDMLAFAHHLPVEECAGNSVKKHWTGNGHAKKPAMIAEAERRGFLPIDDNEADAIAIGDFGLTIHAARSTIAA